MKQLQNNFTTPEQSKRLLELGVPAYSADCYYNSGRYANTPTVIGDKTGRQYEMICGKLIPCWSVGRLIEIYFICSFQPEILIDYTIDDLVHYLVELFDGVAMNFSKIEKEIVL